MESETAQRLFERLRELRGMLDLTQEAFAERLGMSYKYYQQLETGKKEDFRISTLDKVAKGLRIEPWELLHPDSPATAVQEAAAKYGASKPRARRRKV